MRAALKHQFVDRIGNRMLPSGARGDS
jgi:hypothetical protein